jgi:uncharacterized membrane protein
MPQRKATVERLAAFSDAVFAVIITIMVLDLRPPEQPTFGISFTAMLVSLKFPKWGFGLVCCAVLLHLRPQLAGHSRKPGGR